MASKPLSFLVLTRKEMSMFLTHFLTVIWLPHGQLWAIIKGAASLTRCQSLRFCIFHTEGVEKGCIGKKWVNVNEIIIFLKDLDDHTKKVSS